MTVQKTGVVGYPDFWDTARNLDPQFYNQTSELIPLFPGCFGGWESTPPAKVIRAITAVVCNSLDATTILALNGHGFDALLISRSMFEGAVTAAYLAKNPAEVDDYINFTKVSAKTLLDHREMYPTLGSLVDPEAKRTTLERYENVKQRYSNKKGYVRLRWCSKTTEQMFIEVGLAAWYGSFYHMASAATHMNARGLYMSYEPDGDSMKPAISPTENLITTSLAAARVAVLTALSAYLSVSSDPQAKEYLQKALDVFSVTV